MTRLEPLLKEIRHNNKSNLAFTFLPALLIAAMIFVATRVKNAPPAAYIVIVLLIAGCVVWAIFMVVDSRRPAEGHPVAVLLNERPADLVWLYIESSRQTTFIKLGLVDGKELSMLVRPEPADTLMNLIGELAPSAQRGYSPQLAAAFFRDPASLRGEHAV